MRILVSNTLADTLPDHGADADSIAEWAVNQATNRHPHIVALRSILARILEIAPTAEFRRVNAEAPGTHELTREQVENLCLEKG